MVADQPLVGAVQHERDLALRAAPDPAAGPAERHARIATAVEQENRLLAAIDRGLQRARQWARDRAGGLQPHVDHPDLGQPRAVGAP